MDLKRKREPTTASNLPQQPYPKSDGKMNGIATRGEGEFSRARSQALFDLLDDNLCETMTSFCDFHSALRLGSTCHRLKKISNRVLDQSADRVVSELPIYDDKLSDHRIYDADGITYHITDGWQSGFPTKGALIDFAIEHITELGNANEGRARRMLQAREGRVDDDDFVDSTSDDFQESKNRWFVKLRFDEHYSLSAARDFVWDIAEWDWESGNLVKEISHAPWDSESLIQEHSSAKNEWLRYSLFCILRKYQHILELKFASIRWDTRHTDYHSLVEISSLMIQVDDRKIEFVSNVQGRVSMDDWFIYFIFRYS